MDSNKYSNITDPPFVLYDPFILNDLVDMPEMCVFGLVNIDTKSILIYRTTNIVTSLSRIIKEYKYSNNRILKNFELIIIEKIEDPNNLWVRYNFWTNEYSNRGYVIHNKCRYNIKYKLRKQILGDFRMKYNTRPLFYVKVVSRRYKEVTVGVFDNVIDMDAFTNTYYPSDIILNIEYSNNDLTKEYTLVGALVWLLAGILFLIVLIIAWPMDKIYKGIIGCYKAGKRIFNPKWRG